MSGYLDSKHGSIAAKELRDNENGRSDVATQQKST
jgi:hypothetical protein